MLRNSEIDILIALDDERQIVEHAALRISTLGDQLRVVRSERRQLESAKRTAA